MAIVTVLASKPTFIFPESNRVSTARNSFESSTSRLRRCPFLARDTLLRSVTVETGEATQVLASRAGNVGGIDTGGWGGVFSRLSSSSSLVILTCQYILWIKASQLITYLEPQGKLPHSQSLQNHSRRTHRQVWSSRVTRQDLQPSSHDSGVTMTCWCQSSVIYPMTWGGAPSSSSQQPGPVLMRR